MIRCQNCDESFASIHEYQQHRWRDHAGDRDRGEAFHHPGGGRIPVSHLVSDAECPEPPTLEP